MNPPSNLPPPPHPEPDVVRANEILVKGYCAAQNVLTLTQLDLHQVHYHQDRVWSELIPLLDVISESTSDAATRSWCHTVTITIANLFNELVRRESLAQQRFVTLPIFPDSSDGC